MQRDGCDERALPGAAGAAKRISLALIGVLCSLAVTTTAVRAADDYPNRPIRILVPFPPGGATDVVARALAEQYRKILKQTAVVENKPGAFGMIAISELTRAAPDGYTLMVGFVNTNAVTPVLFASKMPDYRKSVVPIGRLVESIQTALALVAGGLGVSLQPASVHVLNRTGVVIRPLDDSPACAEMGLVFPHGPPSPTMDSFLEIVRSLVADPPG